MRSIKLLIAVPFLGFLGFLPWANRIEPYVLGMPFLLFWLVLWMVISPIILMIVYKLDPDNREGETE
ncbi:DUF3311 domain-containing protein [Sporosarcina sp. HYO08]|uniref:DUF3311 domain-containing protein n=1 Tax=Sporosarcina sp. HYO08 TaxID=1759557 RepID=UPI000793A265|nr:DUF3311 domain-containing protein [Sporosarcina sp. HYO08]KXH83798.1 hypothetical protein AU377_03270 [Sporosarcina sp. HYO08]